MQIAVGLPRVAKDGWRGWQRYRFCLFVGVAAVIALSSTYRVAEAQQIFDVRFYKDAEPVIEAIDHILATEKCLFEFRAEDLTKQANDALVKLEEGQAALERSATAGLVGRSRASVARLQAAYDNEHLRVNIDRIQKKPRCLNVVGRPPPSPPQSPRRQPREVWAGDGDVGFEPHVSVGLGGSSGTSSYERSGGLAAPFSGDWSQSIGQVCGGATLYPGLIIGPARIGLDVNVCSGSNTFGSGDAKLFTVMRDGPGDTTLRSSTNAVIDLLLLDAEVSLAQVLVQQQAWSLKIGIGPSFRNQTLTLTSDQSFFGGGVPSISTTTWQPGFVISTGLSTFVCPSCIGGNPLEVGIEGSARVFPSRALNLPSLVFGFTDTGSTGATTDYSAAVIFRVPVTLKK